MVYKCPHFTQGQKYLVMYCSKRKPFKLPKSAQEVGEGKNVNCKGCFFIFSEG